MKHLLTKLFLLAWTPAMATVDVSQSDLLGHWACHENRDGTSQNSQLIYRSNGRFKIKFTMLFDDSAVSTGMHGTLNGKWSVQGETLTMKVVRSRVYLTANRGKVIVGKVGRTISVLDKTSNSRIISFDGDNMVISTAGGAGPMVCKRTK